MGKNKSIGCEGSPKWRSMQRLTELFIVRSCCEGSPKWRSMQRMSSVLHQGGSCEGSPKWRSMQLSRAPQTAILVVKGLRNGGPCNTFSTSLVRNIVVKGLRNGGPCNFYRRLYVHCIGCEGSPKWRSMQLVSN